MQNNYCDLFTHDGDCLKIEYYPFISRLVLVKHVFPTFLRNAKIVSHNLRSHNLRY